LKAEPFLLAHYSAWREMVPSGVVICTFLFGASVAFGGFC